MTKVGWGRFALVGFLWGMPYLFIKVAVEEISVGASDFNKKYLETKRTVMGHLMGKA